MAIFFAISMIRTRWPISDKSTRVRAAMDITLRRVCALKQWPSICCLTMPSYSCHGNRLDAIALGDELLKTEKLAPLWESWQDFIVDYFSD